MNNSYPQIENHQLKQRLTKRPMAHNYIYVKSCALHNAGPCGYRPYPSPGVPLVCGGSRSKFFRNPLEDVI